MSVVGTASLLGHAAKAKKGGAFVGQASLPVFAAENSRGNRRQTSSQARVLAEAMRLGSLFDAKTGWEACPTVGQASQPVIATGISYKRWRQRAKRVWEACEIGNVMVVRQVSKPVRCSDRLGSLSYTANPHETGCKDAKEYS